MTDEITIAALIEKLEAAKKFPDIFGFVKLDAVAFALGKSRRQVERMLANGEFLAGEVCTRNGSRRISVAGLARWHNDGLIPARY